MSMLEKFTNAELRAKLLEHGVDIPVSVSKDFMIKKLKSIEEKKRLDEKKKASVAPTPRKSPPPPLQSRVSPTPSSNTSSSTSHSSEEETRRKNPRSRPPDPKRRRDGGDGDGVDGRASSCSTRRQRSSPPRSLNSFRPMTRASTGRVIKQKPRGRSRSPRASTPRVTTRVKTERGRSDYEYEDNPRVPVSQSTAYQQPHPSEQFHHFSPVLAPSYQGSVPSQDMSPSKSNMFGVVVPGRMVSTDFLANQTVGATKFQMDLREADKVDHVVLFLTGNEPFPPGTGGQIFFRWTNPATPNGDVADTWNKLGFITNEKPSVIYKISELRNFVLHQTAMQGNPQGPFPFNTAQLGISIEPLEVILKSISPQLEL